MRQIVGLNSLRFFAAMLVLVFHCNDGLRQFDGNLFRHYPILQKGWFAVDYFFVLSGFLITALALFEKQTTHSFSIRRFFIRRVLRIFPLYYLSVFIGMILIGWIYPYFYQDTFFDFSIWDALGYYLFFLPNLVVVTWDNIGPTYSLWSIGVEEQFYLLFPILIFIVFRVRHKSWLLFSFLGIYLLFYLAVTGSLLDIGSLLGKLITQTLRFHFFFLGMLLGHLFVHRHGHRVFLFLERKLVQMLILGALILYLIFIETKQDPHNLIGALLFSMLMINIARAKSILPFNNSVIEYLGLISFGIYIFHPYASLFFRFIMERNLYFKDLVVRFPIVFYFLVTALTIGVSTISYRYYESYFIGLKRRYISKAS